VRTFAQKPRAAQDTNSPDSAKPGRSLTGRRRVQHTALQTRGAGSNEAPHADPFVRDASGFGHDLSRVPVRRAAHANVQTKLKIDEPGDAYEQEADRVAEQVTRTSEPRLQRACACGGEAGAGGSCDACNRKKSLQRKAEGGGAVGNVPPQVGSALAAPGRPLDAATRSFFESRFGHDFSRVRVHTDDAAAASVRAHAFTVGERIVFAANQYRPTTHEGRRLLAHELTHVVQQSGADSSAPGLQGALQRKGNDDGSDGGEVQVIAKENGKVAVVFVRGGKIVRGYAEITPPPGVTAAAAAKQVHFTEDWSVAGSLPKVDVILPPGWGRQATNPDAAVEVMDTEAFEQKSEAERIASERTAKADEMRALYREYVNDYQFQNEKFGTVLPLSPRDTPEMKSEDELLDLPRDNFFFEWMQRRNKKAEWKDFQARAGAAGYTDPEGVREMWKEYRQPELEGRQQVEKQSHDVKNDPENALRQHILRPLVLKWVASEPKPVEVPGAEGKKVYVLPLPDGNVATLDEKQYAKLRENAKNEIDTQLRSIETKTGLYALHKREHGGDFLDTLFGASLEGKSWGSVDKEVGEGRDALKKGDLQASLEHIEGAKRHASVAEREWNKYLHAREVGAEVTLTGLELVKKGTDIVLAVGTAPMGGWGIILVTGKAVAESVVVAALKSSGGEHVDWKDVGFEVGTAVLTGALAHGMGSLMKLGPGNPVMQVLRENLGAQLATDAVQSVLMDSATYAARRAYEQARGRGEKFTTDDFLRHVTDYVTDPTKLPLDVLKAQAGRLAAKMYAKHQNPFGPAYAADVEAAMAAQKAAKSSTPEIAPAAEGPSAARDAHATPVAEPPSVAEPPQGATASPPEPAGKATAASEPTPSVKVEIVGGGKGGKAKGTVETPAQEPPAAAGERTPTNESDAAKATAGGSETEAPARGDEPMKRPPEAEARKIGEVIREDPANIKGVKDPSLEKKYDVEIEIEVDGEKHTYRRRRSDKTWCRFSTINCGMPIDPADQEFINRVAAGEFAVAAGWAVEDYKGALGLSRPQEFNFPGIDGWTGGKERPASQNPSNLPEIHGARKVVQVKAMNSLRNKNVWAQWDAGVEGLNQSSWEGTKLVVRGARARELHMIFDEGTFSRLSYGQEMALRAEMAQMTAMALGGHYPIKVIWFQFVHGRIRPIKL
jgi:hypothetical protein